MHSLALGKIRAYCGTLQCTIVAVWPAELYWMMHVRIN
jgi:hypothetical protein